MAGKFINTQYFEAQDKITDIYQDLLQNPFYLYNDKKGTKVKYYNINTEKSTLDPGSKLAYSNLGDSSPIRFNIINGLYLYQFIKAELNLDNGEFGLESSPVEGESYILPNTIIPYEGDFFEVEHVKDSTWLFQINDVQKDTLENGNNVYKIRWQLDRTTNKDILSNIVDEYMYIETQQGSNLKAVVKMEKYDMAKRLDELSVNLATFFKDLFYSDAIQTFTYKWYNEYSMYDPFAIEFIIRHKLLNNSGSYLYIEHKSQTPKTFSIDYNQSIYRAFELRDIRKLEVCQRNSQADYIDDPTSIFATRYENYFALNYHVYAEENGPYNPKGIIPILSDTMMDHIRRNKKYDTCDESYNNILVKFFNNEDLTIEDINGLENIEYQSTKDIFYILLFIIYCLDYYTKKMLS